MITKNAPLLGELFNRFLRKATLCFREEGLILERRIIGSFLVWRWDSTAHHDLDIPSFLGYDQPERPLLRSFSVSDRQMSHWSNRFHFSIHSSFLTIKDREIVTHVDLVCSSKSYLHNKF